MLCSRYPRIVSKMICFVTNTPVLLQHDMFCNKYHFVSRVICFVTSIHVLFFQLDQVKIPHTFVLHTYTKPTKCTFCNKVGILVLCSTRIITVDSFKTAWPRIVSSGSCWCFQAGSPVQGLQVGSHFAMSVVTGRHRQDCRSKINFITEQICNWGKYLDKKNGNITQLKMCWLQVQRAQEVLREGAKGLHW